MKRTKFTAVILTVCLALCGCFAGGRIILQSLYVQSRAVDQFDADALGEVISGVDTSALGALLDNVEDNGLDNIDLGSVDWGSLIGGALTGGIDTANGGTLADSIREKLGSVAGTFTDNELLQAFAATIYSFATSQWDDSMLINNEFVQALIGNLDNVNGNTTQITTAAGAATVASTQSTLTTANSANGVSTVISATNATAASTQVYTQASTVAPATLAAATTAVVASPSAATSVTSVSSVSATASGSVELTSNYGDGIIVENAMTIDGYTMVDMPTDVNGSAVDYGTTAVPGEEESGFSGKMVIGILILLLSVGAVVAIAILMKKKRL